MGASGGEGCPTCIPGLGEGRGLGAALPDSASGTSWPSSSSLAALASPSTQTRPWPPGPHTGPAVWRPWISTGLHSFLPSSLYARHLREALPHPSPTPQVLYTRHLREALPHPSPTPQVLPCAPPCPLPPPNRLPGPQPQFLVSSQGEELLGDLALFTLVTAIAPGLEQCLHKPGPPGPGLRGS